MATRKNRAPVEGGKSYQVLSRLEHDGELYEPSRDGVVEIVLDDDQAKPLLAAGVIQLASAEPAAA